MLTFMGLILRENDRGETSKSVTVLTAERGVIDIFVRGGRKSTKNASSTQLFAYSKLCVEEKKNSKDQSMFFLNSSDALVEAEHDHVGNGQIHEAEEQDDVGTLHQAEMFCFHQDTPSISSSSKLDVKLMHSSTMIISTRLMAEPTFRL